MVCMYFWCVCIGEESQKTRPTWHFAGKRAAFISGGTHKEPVHLSELFPHHLMPHHLTYFLKIIFMNLRVKINYLKCQILVREIQTYLIAILR